MHPALEFWFCLLFYHQVYAIWFNLIGLLYFRKPIPLQSIWSPLLYVVVSHLQLIQRSQLMWQSCRLVSRYAEKLFHVVKFWKELVLTSMVNLISQSAWLEVSLLQLFTFTVQASEMWFSDSQRRQNQGPLSGIVLGIFLLVFLLLGVNVHLETSLTCSKFAKS